MDVLYPRVHFYYSPYLFHMDDTMNASKLLLESLKNYQVENVFGLPGETTLPLYKEWLEYPEIKHVLCRDERSSVFMADVYARFSFKPGICEGPSVGSTHMMPGVAEAYKSSTPLIVLTSDIPLEFEKRNMLTGIDQTSLFRGITKETLTPSKASEIPSLIRRAFRTATTGKPGPVHLRLPSDLLEEEVNESFNYFQRDFSVYPGHRPVAQGDKISKTIELLGKAERPVIICGQGVLYSQAWDEVIQVAELFCIPVGTTINGKGSFPEIHPLSLGVIGARGGKSWSNKVVKNADLIFFIGSSTDSAGTDNWSIPPVDIEAKIISLNISAVEAGNNYPVYVFLIGDAKSTLNAILKSAKIEKGKFYEKTRIKKLVNQAKEFDKNNTASSEEKGPVHPINFIRELEKALPNNFGMVMDVGTAAIYTSTFLKLKRPGRTLAYNFAMGALGFAIPASVGAYCARPNDCIVGLVGDGSFGLTAAELETINRIGGNINLILINNQSYGWIRAELLLSYGEKYVDFSTNFKPVNYLKIAEGFGLKAHRVTKNSELFDTLAKAFSDPEPNFIDVLMEPEDKLIPPVPKWLKKAKEKGLRHIG